MLAIVLSLAPCSSAYVLSPHRVSSRAAPQRSATCHVAMGMFDGLAGAFANDDSLGEQKSAGLSAPACESCPRSLGARRPRGHPHRSRGPPARLLGARPLGPRGEPRSAGLSERRLC